MSPKLAILQRQLKIQPGEKTPAADGHGHGLGVAIEKLIEGMVADRVKEALEQQPVRSPHVRRLENSFNAPAPVPPTPRRPPVAMELQFQRNELGQINMVNMGKMQFRVQRNELGQIVRMIPADIAPVPPAITPPELKQARE